MMDTNFTVGTSLMADSTTREMDLHTLGRPSTAAEGSHTVAADLHTVLADSTAAEVDSMAEPDFTAVDLVGTWAAEAVVTDNGPHLYLSGTASPGNAENGKKLFIDKGCFQCHGTLRQGGPSAKVR